MAKCVKTGCCATLLAAGMVLCSPVALAQKQGEKELSPPYSERQLPNIIGKWKSLKLGFVVPGASVDLASKGLTGTSRDLWKYLYLTHGKYGFFLQNLNDLRLYVQIPDGPTALRYVRLLTSPETLYLWKSRKLAAEIMEAAVAVNLPNYGLAEQPLIASPVLTEWTKRGSKTTFWLYDRRSRVMKFVHVGHDYEKPKARPGTTNPPDFSILGDGKMGIVTRKAYRAGKFSPASVTPVKGGFQITRWLFLAEYNGKDRNESVQHVQEFVGKDGEYRRTVLKTISPPPILPDIRLTLDLYID